MPSTVGIVASGHYESAAFDPTSVAGCELWLDASDAATFTFSSGSIVSQWNDKSGNGYHVAQSTGSAQPSRSGTMNSLSTVVFDGSDDGLVAAGSIGLSQPFTSFVVFTPTYQFDWMPMIGNNGDRYVTLNWPGSNKSLAVFTGGDATTAMTVPDATAVVVSVVTSGGTSTAYKDGTGVAGVSTGASGLGTLSVGIGGYKFKGQIAEVVVYNSALGTTDREAVEDYLRTKWATP